MTTYEIIVTDVTRYGTLYCVAGWDRIRGGMIRPEPSGAIAANEPSRFWDGQHAGPNRTFAVGNIVRFDANAPAANFQFPHATEDRILVAGQPIMLVGQQTVAQTAQAVAGGISPTLEAAFNNGLIRAASNKAHVPIGYNGRSLGAIEIAPNQIQFYVQSFDPAKPQLRSRITVGNNLYDLSVPADAAKSRWQGQGLAGLQADAQASMRIHVRVGLSRPFAAMPNSCYSQVNGLYFL
ncbi:hypothetical protein [Mesorhizobium sp. M0185]|uniref:dual OB domain-containing protein n=1 Tax=unclassified Mesorhizobium TaxID=325217 RepID=UPI00333CD333